MTTPAPYTLAEFGHRGGASPHAFIVARFLDAGGQP